MNIQNNATKKNGLTATFTGTNKSVSVTGASHNHGGYTGYTQPTFSGTEGDISVSGGDHRHKDGTESTANASGNFGVQTPGYGGVHYTGYSGDLSLSGKFTPKGTVQNHRHSITSSGSLSMSGTFTPEGSVTVGAGDSETRPDNYSYVIWKRIA